MTATPCYCESDYLPEGQHERQCLSARAELVERIARGKATRPRHAKSMACLNSDHAVCAVNLVVDAAGTKTPCTCECHT